MRRFKFAVLPLAVLLLLLSLTGVVLADGESSDEESDVYTHEACEPYARFNYNGTTQHLDWGGGVVCSPGINEIFMSAELLWQTSAGNWVISDSDLKTCYDNTCDITIGLNYMPDGDYKVTICYQAESPTSNFWWSCQSRSGYSIP